MQGCHVCHRNQQEQGPQGPEGLHSHCHCIVLNFITPRKAQNARECASEQLHKSRDAVLFSLDARACGMDYPNVTFILQVGGTASNLMPYLGGQHLNANGLNINLLGQRRTQRGDHRPLQHLTYVVWVNLSTTMRGRHCCCTIAINVGATTVAPYPEQLKFSTMLLSQFLVVQIGDQKIHQSPEVRGVNLVEHLNDCLKGQHILKVCV